MLQQLIALIVILFFAARLFILKKRKKISANEFLFWLVFWFLAAVSILSLKWLDRIFAGLGFSASAINVLVYAAVIILFFMNFRLRLRVEKLDRDITKIVRKVGLDEAESKK